MNSFIALDLEMTGLRPKYDKILEIGAVKVVEGEIVEHYETFINPRLKIPKNIVEITHITDEMVSGSPSIEEELLKFLEFCEGFPLLGHNIIFDYSFLKQQACNLSLKFETKGVDTLKISRKVLPDLPSRRLEDLCVHFEIEQKQAHRAWNDAMACMELYEILKNRFEKENPELFLPKPLLYSAKKVRPITKSQKAYLIDLQNYHTIESSINIDALTKNEASRMIDKIILEHGRIQRKLSSDRRMEE